MYALVHIPGNVYHRGVRMRLCLECVMNEEMKAVASELVELAVKLQILAERLRRPAKEQK